MWELARLALLCRTGKEDKTVQREFVLFPFVEETFTTFGGLGKRELYRLFIFLTIKVSTFNYYIVALF